MKIKNAGTTLAAAVAVLMFTTGCPPTGETVDDAGPGETTSATTTTTSTTSTTSTTASNTVSSATVSTASVTGSSATVSTVSSAASSASVAGSSASSASVSGSAASSASVSGSSASSASVTGASSSGDVSSSSNGASSSSGGVPAATCADYCTVIMANCQGGDAQYTDEAECLADCAYFPQGTQGDQTGNNLECRAYHATAASGNVVHCPHAGRDGTAFCESVAGSGACEHFCDVVETNCLTTDYPYTDRDSCLVNCYAMTAGTDDETTLNTRECRLYHAEAAATDTVHCAHAGAVSDGFCEDNAGESACEHYCDMELTWCTSDNQAAQYVDYTSCMRACGEMVPALVAGNTLECRAYHVEVAALTPNERTDHCYHSGPTGGGSADVCNAGSRCDLLCDLVDTACGFGGLSLAGYNNRADCLTDCESIPYAFYNASADSNTLECRFYHATAALSGVVGDDALHCQHVGSTSAPCIEIPTVVNGCLETDYQPASTTTIDGVNTAYDPACITVQAGNSVTLPGTVNHPLQGQYEVAYVSNPFQAGAASDVDVSEVLNTPGFYGFYCNFHGDPDWSVADYSTSMVGTVWVTP